MEINYPSQSGVIKTDLFTKCSTMINKKRFKA
jgi:hypothetical protein